MDRKILTILKKKYSAHEHFFEKQQVKTKKKKTSIQLLLLHWIVNQPTDPYVRKCFSHHDDYNNLDINFRAIYL